MRYLLSTASLLTVLSMLGFALIAIVTVAVSPSIQVSATMEPERTKGYSVISQEGANPWSFQNLSSNGLPDPGILRACPCLQSRPFWSTFLKVFPSKTIHEVIERSCGCGSSCSPRSII